MTAKITQLYAAQKKILSTKQLASRLSRVERLLKIACILLADADNEQTIVIWPKDLILWYELNVPDKPMSFEEALNELTDEQITALGLWADEEPNETA